VAEGKYDKQEKYSNNILAKEYRVGWPAEVRKVVPRSDIPSPLASPNFHAPIPFPTDSPASFIASYIRETNVF
jgi:hypothetical protein